MGTEAANKDRDYKRAVQFLERACSLAPDEVRLRELHREVQAVADLDHAASLRTRGDLPGAMACLQEAERLCRAMGNKEWLMSCLAMQGVILAERGARHCDGLARGAGTALP